MSGALADFRLPASAARQGLVLNNMGVFAHFQGRWDDALDLYRRAEQAWAKTGDPLSASAHRRAAPLSKRFR